MNKKLLALLTAFAVLIPFIPGPTQVDAFYGQGVPTTCYDSTVRAFTGDFYICYDVSSEQIVVLHWVGGSATTGGTAYVQAGPYSTLGSRKTPTYPSAFPDSTVIYSGLECVAHSGPPSTVTMSPSPTGWGNATGTGTGKNVTIRASSSAVAYDWWTPSLTQAQLDTLRVYAAASVPNYRCMVTP